LHSSPQAAAQKDSARGEWVAAGPRENQDAKSFAAASGKKLQTGQAELTKHEFEQGMRYSAYKGLRNARRAAESALERFRGGSCGYIDRAKLDRTLQRLVPVNAKFFGKCMELDNAQARLKIALSRLALAGPKMGPLYLAREAGARVQRIQAQLAQLQGARIHAAREFPLVLRIPPRQMDKFICRREAGRAAFLRGQARQVLADVREFQAKRSNRNHWTAGCLLYAAASHFAAGSKELKWVEKHAKPAQPSHAAWRGAHESLLAVGFAFGAAAFASSISLATRGTGDMLALDSAFGAPPEFFSDDPVSGAGLPPGERLPSPLAVETPRAGRAMASPAFREAAAGPVADRFRPLPALRAGGGWRRGLAAGIAGYMPGGGKHIFGFGLEASRTAPAQRRGSHNPIAPRVDKPLDTAHYSFPALSYTGNLSK
jgi:hypothetical protein